MYKIFLTINFYIFNRQMLLTGSKEKRKTKKFFKTNFSQTCQIARRYLFRKRKLVNFQCYTSCSLYNETRTYYGHVRRIGFPVIWRLRNTIKFVRCNMDPPLCTTIDSYSIFQKYSTLLDFVKKSIHFNRI